MALKKTLIALVISSAATSCAVTTNDYCLIAKPHQFTDGTIDAMTDEEVKQELVHNKQYEEICEE